MVDPILDFSSAAASAGCFSGATKSASRSVYKKNQRIKTLQKWLIFRWFFLISDEMSRQCSVVLIAIISSLSTRAELLQRIDHCINFALPQRLTLETVARSGYPRQGFIPARNVWSSNFWLSSAAVFGKLKREYVRDRRNEHFC